MPFTPARAPEGWARAFIEQGRTAGRSRMWAEQTWCTLGRFLSWLEAHGCEDLTAATRASVNGFLLAESKKKGRRPGRPPLVSTTMHGKLRTLRRFFAFLVKSRAVLHNPALEVSLGRCVRGTRRAPSREEVRRLLSFEGSAPLDLRDKAILEVLYSTGLRSEELCALEPESVDMAAGTVTVREGKGGKDRLVPIGKKALAALWSYLRKGRPALKPSISALFVTWTGRPMENQDLNVLFRKRRVLAGLEQPITPHQLRHAFATHLLEGGASVRHVQAMLGHSTLESTQIYAHAEARSLKEVLERADIRGALENPPPEEPPPGLGRLPF